MNWTGGRLHRHSKANANVLVKTQKQHFARARLQLQIGRPAPSLTFAILNGQTDDHGQVSKQPGYDSHLLDLPPHLHLDDTLRQPHIRSRPPLPDKRYHRSHENHNKHPDHSVVFAGANELHATDAATPALSDPEQFTSSPRPPSIRGPG